jgi:hypothetical protein
MKKQSSKPTDDTLPGFLDDTPNDTTAATMQADPAEQGDPQHDPLEAVADAADSAPTGDEPAPPTPTTPRASTRRESRHTPRRARGAGAMAGTLGVAALLAAAGLGFANPASSLVVGLTRFGVQPTTLLVSGCVLLGVGATRRRTAEVQVRLDDIAAARTEENATLHDHVQQLVQHSNGQGQAPVAGEELQHMLVLLQRQDEKLANLTKAIKMYGKPLMEIAAQGTELAGTLAQVRTAVDAGQETARQSGVRLENALRSSAPKQEFVDLHEAVRELGSTVEALAGRAAPSLSLEPVQQHLNRVEVAVQSVAHRLDDSEVRKSLLRLEDSTARAREEMQTLLRGETVQRATGELQQRLDLATTRLADGIKELRDGNLGGLETAMREIQREVAGVATTVAQIQAAVKAGARPAAATASAPAPAAATPGAAGQAPSAAATPAAPTAAPAAPASGGADAAGGYQTGTRSSGGKNVLGAIAKLKQMKG